MGRLLELANGSKWSLTYSKNLTAIGGDTFGSFTPIPPHTVPVLLESSFLAIFASSSTSSPRWKTAGWLIQSVNIGVDTGDGGIVRAGRAKKFYLNQTTLLELPKLTSTYQLVVNVPYWLSNLSFTIWQYTGIDETTAICISSDDSAAATIGDSYSSAYFLDIM